jgi:hypothetical protein
MIWNMRRITMKRNIKKIIAMKRNENFARKRPLCHEEDIIWQ